MEVRILVVDDDEDSRNLITNVLSEFGYVVDKSGDVKSAIDLLKEKKYEIVITDKNMPGLHDNMEGGMDLLRYLKKDATETEVILVTGYATIETAIEAMKLGAFDYIHKPFSVKDLHNKIKRILEYRSFINPDNTINIYKSIHNEVLNLIENRDSLRDKELHPLLKSIDQKIDYFFQAQKKWERVLIEQREALGNIAAFVEQIKETLEPANPISSLIEKIGKEANKRL
ncbi:MAG TPA: response regulator [bacterium]|nr:response regulator [bacterium]HPN43203.1 response regulator [bacterium]